MRLELSGTMSPSGAPGPGNPSNPPQLILTYTANDTFVPETYLDQGYTRFDVIAIGAGGGQGGELNPGVPANGTQNQKASGGAGGGGGIQEVLRGLLVALPASCPVVVGAGGVAGTNAATGAGTTNGGDGGASSFNGSTCQASGGKGGKRAQNDGWTTNPLSDGGQGGLGGTSVAGGGGAGGISNGRIAAVPGIWTPGTGIGGGGGGGWGGASATSASSTGVLTENAIAAAPPGSGAGGAYNAVDLSVYSPGSTSGNDPRGALYIPGYAGGAKASPLTGLATTYGDSQVSQTTPAMVGKAGVVILRLTAS